MVMAGGQVVARDGAMAIELAPPSRDGLLTGPFPMAAATPDDFAVRTNLPDGSVNVLAIEVTEQIFVRKRRDVVLQAAEGRVQPDLGQDLALVSVVEPLRQELQPAYRLRGRVRHPVRRAGDLQRPRRQQHRGDRGVAGGHGGGRQPPRRPTAAARWWWTAAGWWSSCPCPSAGSCPTSTRPTCWPRRRSSTGRPRLSAAGWTGRSCTCSSCPSPRSPDYAHHRRGHRRRGRHGHLRPRPRPRHAMTAAVIGLTPNSCRCHDDRRHRRSRRARRAAAALASGGPLRRHRRRPGRGGAAGTAAGGVPQRRTGLRSHRPLPSPGQPAQPGRLRRRLLGVPLPRPALRGRRDLRRFPRPSRRPATEAADLGAPSAQRSVTASSGPA